MKKNNFYNLWGLALIIKLILAAVLPLSADEAYYWVWSNNAQLSYFDHPPFVAWLFYLGHFLEGLGNAVRWPAVILAHVTLLIWYFILKDQFDFKHLMWWLQLTIISIFLGIGSLIVTPDLPLLFFWSLSIYFFQRGLQKKDFLSYALLGLSLGLGFCSKYLIVLLPLIFIIYLTFEKKWSEVKFKYLLVTAISGLIFCLPVLVWNYQNDFVSFKFQFDHGLGETKWEPNWTVSYVLGQIFIFSPLLLWQALRARTQGGLRLFFYLGWLPLAFFLFSSFKGKVEANWPIMAYPSVFVLAAWNLKSDKWIKWINGPIIIAFFAVLLLILMPNKYVPEKINESSYYQPVIENAFKYEHTYAGTYQMASYVWYRTKKPFYKLYNMSRIDVYDYWSGSKPTTDVFYIIRELESELPNWILNQYSIQKIQDVGTKFELLKITKK